MALIRIDIGYALQPREGLLERLRLKKQRRDESRPEIDIRLEDITGQKDTSYLKMPLVELNYGYDKVRIYTDDNGLNISTSMHGIRFEGTNNTRFPVMYNVMKEMN